MEQFNRDGNIVKILQQTKNFYLASTRGAAVAEFYEFGNILMSAGGVVYKDLSHGSYTDCKRMFDTQKGIDQFIAKAALKKAEGRVENLGRGRDNGKRFY